MIDTLDFERRINKCAVREEEPGACGVTVE